ncbi:hypothetical protein C2E23DRAFT_578914 [Lenzites betulinus]|nr:hypothetical protein C2E23DRAFT_578914 [Lenzites betulinus]
MHFGGRLEYLSGCWRYTLLLLTLCVFPVTWAAVAAAADHTKCASSQLDWYTSVVGETPCKTYERLRQVCNGDYQVPKFATTFPGDICSDQVSGCCCNTVAFALSMLCMNCQQDLLAGNRTGIDARWHPIFNKLCATRISDLMIFYTVVGMMGHGALYDTPPPNQIGLTFSDRFYVWTKENAELEHAAHNNNTFTRCSAQASPSASTSQSGALVSSASSLSVASQTSSSVPTGQAASAQGGSKLSTGASAAIGGVIGASIVILSAGIGFFFWRRRKARNALKCPSNVARRSSNPFQYRPAGPEFVTTPYFVDTDAHGKLGGDIKPRRFG